MPVGTDISLQTAGQFIVVILLAVITAFALASFALRSVSRRRAVSIAPRAGKVLRRTRKRSPRH